MARIRSLLAGGMLAMLAACTTMSAPHPLEGSDWQLVAIDTTGSTTTLIAALQARHTLSFGPEGELALQLDCNRGRASWSAGQPQNGAGAISIGPIASTRALCQDPSFGNELASGLGEAQTYLLTADRRELVIEAATRRFTFAAME